MAVSQMLGVGVGVRMGSIAGGCESDRESVGVGTIVKMSSIGVLVASGISCVVVKLKTGVEVGKGRVSVASRTSVVVKLKTGVEVGKGSVSVASRTSVVVKLKTGVEVGKGSVSVASRTSVEVSGRKKVDKMVSIVTAGLGENVLTDKESSDVGIGRRMDGDGVGEPMKKEELVEFKMGDEKPKMRSDELGDGVRVGEGEGVEALSVRIGVFTNSNTTELVVGKKASENTTVVGKTVVWTMDDGSTVVDGGTISVVSSGKMVDVEGSGVVVRGVLRVSEGDRGVRNSELSEILKINVD